MNYKIIVDELLLIEFINWLPELRDDECYYLCLFARSKYAKNEDGTNKFPHIKSDKSQLKRFIATSKDWILHKIKQLEVSHGSYKTKDGMDIPQESLALYITPNPRSMKGGMFKLMKRLLEIQECQGKNYNIHSEALSAIQKSVGNKVYFDLDIDTNKEIVIDYSKINNEAVNLLKTRGGMHILIELSKISPEFRKTWYQYMTKSFDVDIRGDNMIPVPGTYQGGFIPHFL